jgi:hypothetical protein
MTVSYLHASLYNCSCSLRSRKISESLQTQVLLVCYLWETLTLTMALGAIITISQVVSGPLCNSLEQKRKKDAHIERLKR